MHVRMTSLPPHNQETVTNSLLGLCQPLFIAPRFMAIASGSLGGYTVGQVADGLQACFA